MRTLVVRTATIAGAIVAAACVEYAPSPTETPSSSVSSSMQLTTAAGTALSDAAGSRYLVVFKSGSAASSGVSAELRNSGGVVEGAYDQLGFAVVSGVSSDGAARLAKIPGVASVAPDVEFAIEGAGETEALAAGDPGIESAAAPQTASQFARQWNMRAIQADAAWAGGALGSSNVTVAILDTGIDYQWPDLVGRVDLSRSISLRPDEDARLAAAVAAGFFPASLLPLHPIAVFNTCSTAAVLNGIVYAVDHGADVINMSLGGGFPKNAAPGFVSVINRVFDYANRNGTLIVVAAGNAAADMDHNGNVYIAYCNSPHVVCVSATGPTAASTPVGPF